MKNVKVLVLTFFLAMTGYGYASGMVQDPCNGSHKKTTASILERACCAGKAECCKPAAECCKPGAPCCKSEASCCEKDKQCCDSGGGCLTKAEATMGECCAMCTGCRTAAAEAGKMRAETIANSCCGSACNRTASAKK